MKRFEAVNALIHSSEVVTVPPLPFDGARVGHCYHNVREMVRTRGGEACYGWALADYGPHRLSPSDEPRPLYRRCVNHVVWKDPQDRLFEVTPGKFILNHDQAKFVATDFLAYSRTTTEVISQYWFGQRCRYVSLRPEGETVTKILNHAQGVSREDLPRYMKQALEAIRGAGFRPRDWKVEAFGNRVASIWLIAE